MYSHSLPPHLADFFARPSISWSGGRNAPLFPLYIQCHSRRDAQEVQNLYEPFMNLYNTASDEVDLAHAIYHSLDCSSVMTNVHVWYALLNGRTFRGILLSSRYVTLLLYSSSCTYPAPAVTLTSRLETSNFSRGERATHSRRH